MKVSNREAAPGERLRVGGEVEVNGVSEPEDDRSVLRVEGLYKAFGQVQAVDNVSFRVSPGEIHGLIGHNGSGKSTVVKMVGGLYNPDAGYIVLGGTVGRGPISRRTGAGTVVTLHQDLGLAPSLSVADNFLVSRTVLGAASGGRRRHILRWRHDRRFVEARLGEMGLMVDARQPVGELSPSERVVLALARVQVELMAELDCEGDGDSANERSALVVLDEPTSRLAGKDVSQLFGALKGFVERLGIGVLLVTHHISDVTGVCNMFTAMKNGRCLGTFRTEEMSAEEIATMMAGGLTPGKSREPALGGGSYSRLEPQQRGQCRESVLTIKSLSGQAVAGVSLSVGAGEVVGVTGLPGSGYEEIPYLVSATRERLEGEVSVAGQSVGLRGFRQFRAAGGLLIASDRARTSGVPGATVRENLLLGDERSLRKRGILARRREVEECKRILKRMAVPLRDMERPLSVLSGGQQQKVIVGRCFRPGRKVLVLDEPAIAVDVGARSVIIGGVREAARQGAGVVYASGQAEELATACDRVAVFAGGAIRGWLVGDEITEENILRLAYS